MRDLVGELVDLLPADGTGMPYAEWKEAMPYTHHRAIQDARRSKAVTFYFVTDEDGNPVHMVRRGE